MKRTQNHSNFLPSDDSKQARIANTYKKHSTFNINNNINILLLLNLLSILSMSVSLLYFCILFLFSMRKTCVFNELSFPSPPPSSSSSSASTTTYYPYYYISLVVHLLKAAIFKTVANKTRAK